MSEECVNFMGMNIFVDFASELKRALSIPKSFWINLHANYEAEKQETIKEQN